jgi:hypothetical protein
MRWATWWLRWIIESLRRREGSLSFHAEQAGPFAPQALTLAAALGCILTDHLGPAADALERAAVNEELLLVEADDGLPKKSERKGSPR